MTYVVEKIFFTHKLVPRFSLMRIRILLMLLISWTCSGQPTNTALAAIVLAGANFQNPEAARLTLNTALERATLVIQATVTKSNTVIEASPVQTAVSAGQGWRAIVVEPRRV